MPWVAAIGAVVGGVGSSLISSGASTSAANTQAASAANATDAELNMFNATQTNLQPFVNAGQNALPVLQQQIGLNADGTYNPNAPLVTPFTQAQFQSSPGYQFQLDAGKTAIQNTAAANGGLVSGNTLSQLTQFGQGLANEDWWNAYNAYTQNQNQRFNFLNNQVQLGANTAARQGGLSAQVGQQVGSNMIGAGNALAAGQIGSANAISGGVNNLAQLAYLYGNSYSGGGGGNGMANYSQGNTYTSPDGYISNLPNG